MMSRKQTSTQKHSTMKQETRPSLMDSTASQHSDFSNAWSEEGETSERKNQFTMKVSGSFASLSLLFAMGLAFVMGRASRLLLIEGPRQKLLQEVEKATEVSSRNEPTVPSLITLDRQKIPQTRYLSKNFDTGLSATMSSWLTIDRNTPDYQQKEDSTRGKNESERCTSFGVKEFVESTEPSAQHLMVDIKNVDGSFLNSEPRLAQAIVDLVHEADLPLLSYHCHGFNPLGVSCVGVMMRNYLSFHTWPEAGVITFDIAASESKIILPLLSSIERLFGVARNPTFPGQVTAKPEFRYAYKLRGFRHNPSEIENLFEATDLGDILTILGTDLKEEVASVTTDFQRVDIYDVLIPHRGSLESYHMSLLNDESYEAQNKFLFRPDRVIMLDGWLQSSLLFEAMYHEALVHPALFSHSNPKRVAIIGGGEGATLREVLKHNTVSEAIMIEIDEEMVNVSREHIPEWSDCSDLVGSSDWCIEDPRATAFYQDALEWFMDCYGDDTSPSEQLDVIILDALDPESEIPFAEALYGNDDFMQAFYNSLTDDGILVMQLGESPPFHSPDETRSKFKNRAKTTDLLEKLGFESIHVYEEAHCGFHAPWTYVVGFKSHNSRTRWYANVAQIDLDIQKRSVPTKSGTSPFRFFDGSTMASYQVPHKTVESVFCRRHPTPEECFEGYNLDTSYPNIPVTSFEVKTSTIEGGGRGLFTKVDIPENAYIWAESSTSKVNFMPSTSTLITALEEEPPAKRSKVLSSYMEGYGYSSQFFGDDPGEVFVDSGIITFANHGCNGTNNVGTKSSFDEFTVDLQNIPEEFSGESHANTSTFNPVIDRHLRHQFDRSLRAIGAGEEIFDNYLAFTGNGKDWAKAVQELRDVCSGKSVGLVTNYERDHS